MKARRSKRFDRDYVKAPKEIQAALDKQVALLHDLRYPSLRAEKYDEGKDLWQARVPALGVSISRLPAIPITLFG